MDNTQKQKKHIDFHTLGRVLGELFKSYPVLLPVTCLCIVFTSVVSSIPAVFNQQILAITEDFFDRGDLNWSAAAELIVPKVILLIFMYVLSIASLTSYRLFLAYIGQDFLRRMREKMFNSMQNAPIRFFDTHKHGDVMSCYTNDIDTLRELVSQALPTTLAASVIVLTVFLIMLWYSVG